MRAVGVNVTVIVQALLAASVVPQVVVLVNAVDPVITKYPLVVWVTSASQLPLLFL
jgi:hypothetical protein